MTYAIVLAGGSGKRFGGEIPKQYMQLCDKPVIAWSLLAFEKSNADGIVLVCAEKDIEFCHREIIQKYGISKCISIAAGGENRYDSVFHGLEAAVHHGKENGIDLNEACCLIHDGARPCIDVTTINDCISYVKEKGSCVVGVPVTDTIQIVNEKGDIAMTPSRTHTWAAQTPQCFKLSLAYESCKRAVEERDDSITDDASAVRKYGEGAIHMLLGKKENIKITAPADMERAEEILRKEDSK